MFTITKDAKIHHSVASKSFSVAEIAGMRSRGNYHIFPFSVEVVGCGSEPPDDYDPEKSRKFPLDETYDVNGFLIDISTIVEDHSLSAAIRAWNNGWDLSRRSSARPTAAAKMNDAAKAAWILVNSPEIAGTLDSLAAYAAWYDANVQNGNASE